MYNLCNFAIVFFTIHFSILAIYRNIRDLSFENTVVTVGSFDGVHCGHQMLLQHVVDRASRRKLRSVALTFWPHPRQTLHPNDKATLLLNTLDEKITLLEQSGVDDIVIFPFDKTLSQMSAPDFIKDVVIGSLGARYLIMGQDHRFGKDRSGDVQLLQALIAHHGLQVEVVDLKMLDRKISSSAIREALSCGDLSLAIEMLGYEYLISGKVIAGNRLGRTIGFPTANIETPDFKMLPKEGVYRVVVQTGNIRTTRANPKHTGMLYIGKRPVLKQGDATVRIEVNIFDFCQQIYGQEITLALTHRIRDEVMFENVEQLAEQLHRDKQNILAI